MIRSASRFLPCLLLLAALQTGVARAADPNIADSLGMDWSKVPEYRLVPGDKIEIDLGPKPDPSTEFVRDVTIRGNRVLECGEPVIRIAPENRTSKPDEPVHRNIRIEDNFFLCGGNAISAKSTQGLSIRGNRFSSKTLPVRQTACTDVVIENNKLEAKE